MDRKILKGLATSAYEHPFDKKALEALKNTPGLPALIKTVRKYSFDKIQKVIHTGSYLQVGPRQFSHLNDLFIEACRILDFSVQPKLYIMNQYEINAYATCYADPIVMIGSGCLDVLSDEELLFIMGHELGHVKSQHLLYNDLAYLISYFGAIIGDMTLGIGGLLSKGLELALLYWARMSELTCDRAGLLATQNFDISVSTIAKMAGAPRSYINEISTEAFLQQAREFEGFDFDVLDKIAKALSVMQSTHPWTVMRASELDKWVQAGDYEDVLNKKFDKPSFGTGPMIQCPACGSMTAEHGNFCAACGSRLEQVG